MKCSVYIAASLDGFIAKPDGGIDWLENPEYSKSPMAGLGYEEFMSNVDALIMGRNSFEKALSFGAWPYDGTRVIVLSSRPLEIPSNLEGKVHVDGGAPCEIIGRLQAEGMDHLYVDGGITLQRFLQDGQINEITVTFIPVILGSGIPLFGSLGTQLSLRLLAATPSENGFVQVRYEVNPSA